MAKRFAHPAGWPISANTVRLTDAQLLQHQFAFLQACDTFNGDAPLDRQALAERLAAMIDRFTANKELMGRGVHEKLVAMRHHAGKLSKLIESDAAIGQLFQNRLGSGDARLVIVLNQIASHADSLAQRLDGERELGRRGSPPSADLILIRNALALYAELGGARRPVWFVEAVFKLAGAAAPNRHTVRSEWQGLVNLKLVR
jgi:hypothetical protein